MKEGQAHPAEGLNAYRIIGAKDESEKKNDMEEAELGGTPH